MKANKLLAASLAMGLVVSTMFTPVLSASAAGSKSYGGEVDVSTSTFKADTDNSAAFQTWRDGVWSTEKADSGKIALTPGKTEKDLNFAWYSEKGDSDATPVVHFGTDKDNLETFEGTAGDVDQSLTGDKAYEYNHVTVTGLEPNTTYYYTVEKNG